MTTATAGLESALNLETQSETYLSALNAVFLAWSPPSHTRRSYIFAKLLNIPLLRVYILKPKSAIIRYLVQAVKTLLVLMRYRPKVIFVQNPPVFAVLMVFLYCKMASAHFVVDSHTGAFAPVWDRLLSLHRFLSRQAVVTFVTNEHLRDLIVKWGGKAYIIRDIPSDFPIGQPAQLKHSFNVVMVCTYSNDEPLEAVFEVAATLPETGFYITGNPNRASKPLPTNIPVNVHLTGYLEEEDYYGLLRSAQVVMSLTTTDHTMQRGACEAVWLGKPIITSNWPLLKEFFHKGTIHVDNSAKDIRRAVLQMQQVHVNLAEKIEELQIERRKMWKQYMTEVQTIIQNLRNKS